MIKRTHNYCIEVTTTTDHDKRIDENNGNAYWKCAIDKELFNASVSFMILNYGGSLTPGYSKVRSHLIFDVLLDFTRKDR